MTNPHIKEIGKRFHTCEETGDWFEFEPYYIVEYIRSHVHRVYINLGVDGILWLHMYIDTKIELKIVVSFM